MHDRTMLWVTNPEHTEPKQIMIKDLTDAHLDNIIKYVLEKHPERYTKTVKDTVIKEKEYRQRLKQRNQLDYDEPVNRLRRSILGQKEVLNDSAT